MKKRISHYTRQKCVKTGFKKGLAGMETNVNLHTERKR